MTQYVAGYAFWPPPPPDTVTPDTPLRIHLIAICGTAMAPLAVMLKSLGHHITGSDVDIYPPMSTVLAEQGIPVYKGFAHQNLEPRPDLVIIGNAISRGNPEAEAVLSNKIRYLSQASALREFFLWDKRSMVVTGTHGKTTTTSLLAWLLDSAGHHPSFMIGGVPIGWDSGARIGVGDSFIIEGDEYDTAFFDKRAKFLNYVPDIAIINNIEFDHADIYGSLDEIVLAFRRLVNLVPGNGLLIGNADHPIVRSLMTDTHCPVRSYGLMPDSDADWHATDVGISRRGTSFHVQYLAEDRGMVTLPMWGRHNVSNALASVAAASEAGVSWDQIVAGIGSFPGVKRRMEVRGTVNGIVVYDDFAHHPTAVKATIDSLREAEPNSTIWAIFEPRTATTIRDIFQSAYEHAFGGSNHVIVAPVFNPAKAPQDRRFSVNELIRKLRSGGVEAMAADGVDAIVVHVAAQAKPGDHILFMSNGGFGGIHEKTLSALRERFPAD